MGPTCDMRPLSTGAIGFHGLLLQRLSDPSPFALAASGNLSRFALTAFVSLRKLRTKQPPSLCDPPHHSLGSTSLFNSHWAFAIFLDNIRTSVMPKGSTAYVQPRSSLSSSIMLSRDLSILIRGLTSSADAFIHNLLVPSLLET
ncbi:uncharacterized protein TrAtP1_007548 [Trichoderma atroviride]|uniref:uncharacterized protein n=1 Tax=Hypocrea atroviridis TaxID=63577 RepID=UPI00331F0306|nr:hypothetical protein TrAtP1_007548 [Trichoderma atroviride]